MNLRRACNRQCQNKWKLCIAFFVPPIFILTLLMSYREIVNMEVLQCKPKKNLVYVRAHKSGSSTVQNILIRYGNRQNLTFVLPKEKIYIGDPDPFLRSMLPSTKDKEQKYDLLVHHIRLNYEEVRLLMEPDSIFFTMIRDPVDLFESLFHYVSLEELYLMDLSEFIEAASVTITPRFASRYANGIAGINQIAFDMGLKTTDFLSRNTVKRFVRLLDDYFDLVMITERFEESIILLKDLLCLKLDDVTFFHLNKRHENVRSKLSREQREKLRIINAADQAIYDYFKRKFDERVEAYGKERMKKEVELLRTKNLELFQKCVTGEEKRSIITKWGKNYTFIRPRLFYNVIEDNDCLGMVEPEIITSDYLREKQKHIYA